MKNIIFALGVVISTPAFSQETDQLDSLSNNQKLEEVIIQGNRIQVPFSQITRDIQVITQEQIVQLPAKSLNEVLTYISGVDIRQRGPFGTQTDISIDGGTFEQTLILIDGVKMIDAQSAHNMMNIPIALSAIHHIEVLRGAAARLYGINALSGAINIVTKKEKHSFLSADVQAGSSLKSKDKRDGNGIYGGGSAELTANFGNEKQNQLFSINQSLYNGQRYNSGAKNTRLFYSGNYHVDENNSIHALAGYARSHFGANGFYAAPGDVNSEELVKSSLFSISSKHRLGRLTVSPRISDRYGDDDYRYFKDDLSKGRSVHYNNALMLELNNTLETDLGTLGFGWESRFETINSSNIGEHQRNNHGAYAEFKSQLGERITGTVGSYANYNTDYGWQLYPGIDLAYHINAQWRVSTSVGSGQRIPSFTDLYLNQLPGNVGNENLEAESAWNYEGNIQYNKENFRIQGGYFYRNISDFIDWVREETSQPYSPVNFRSNKMQGIYGRINQQMSIGARQSLGFHASYNYLRPTAKVADGTFSKYALESLKHQFVAGVNYKVDRFSGQIENRLLKRELGSAYAITDIRLNYQFEKILLYTDLTNLFNTEYIETGAVPMPSRWFSVGMKFNWNQL